ncbi:maleylpyruvate isomerase family mycothiol-dependent enzyme [Krasilnikovia sp. MM14-A1259]|uniref:maleylpyruvate isomerase family mycothiol-dependent enzyme n=1 Tax=Krasilnikovia sp. MM14-A1259 TaxID=3373539 RepID=UPI0037F98307
MTTPSFPELLSLVDERSTALRAAVAAGDPAAPVPGCPDWSLRDLTVHLGHVHRFWAVAVSDADPAAAPARDRVPDPEPTGDLLDWSAASTRLLLDALGEAGPGQPCWTWWGTSGAPMTAGAVARHQVQEAAVHAFDAQEAIGRPEPLPGSCAVDGVAEFVQVGLGSEGAWPHAAARIAFVTAEGPSWLVDLSPAGVRLDPAGSSPEPDPAAGGEPRATVRGPAGDLVLALYRRIPLERVRVDGDRELVELLLTWGDTE